MNERPSRIFGALASAIALIVVAGTAAGDPPFREDGETPATSPISNPPPEVRIADARIKEGDSGPAHLLFTVRLAGPFEGQATVDFTTVDGTATVADGDYEAASGTLVFSPTDTVRTIDVIVHGDLRLEGNEWFSVRLSHPRAIALAHSDAIGTIANDEGTHFVAVSASVPPYVYGTLPNAWGDYDNDGIPDLPLYGLQSNGSLVEIPGFKDLLAQGNMVPHGATTTVTAGSIWRSWATRSSTAATPRRAACCETKDRACSSMSRRPWA